MSLEMTLLGFLKSGEKTGYEIQKKIEKSINHFWTSTQSQIYRTLNTMEESALLVSKIHYQEEKPNRKVYSITEKGEKKLIEWLTSPIVIPSHRNPFLVQLFFSGSIDKKEIIANLKHYKNDMEQRLLFLKNDEVKKLISLGKNKKERFLYQAIVDNGICVLESEIGWAESTIREIDMV